MAVKREKVRTLPGDTLAELARTDELELLYLHLYSMRNFNHVKDRLMGALSSEAEVSQASPEPSVPASERTMVPG